MVPYNTSPVIPIIGNGTLKTFNVTFPTYEISDVVAEVVEDATGSKEALELDVEFTVSNIGIPNTPAILNLIGAPKPWLDAMGNLKTGYTLFIKFNPNTYQLVNLRNMGRYTPEVIEQALDRLTLGVMSVQGLAQTALGIPETEAGVNVTLPPLSGNADKLLQVNEDANGFSYGPSYQSLIDDKNDAQDAAQDAAAHRADALAAKVDAQTAATAAQLAQTNAQASATAADNSADSATQSELAAELARQQSEFYASLDLFDEVVNLNYTDSPYTVDITEDKRMFVVDDSLGDVELILPAISTTPIGWKIGVLKQFDNANEVTAEPDGADTINGTPGMVIHTGSYGAVLYANSPTDWRARYFVSSTASVGGGASGSLPAGGVAGDLLVKQSATVGDADWISYGYSGYSARFSTAVNTSDLDATLRLILNLQYLSSLISLSASGSGTVREKGTVVAATSLTATTTKRSDPIAKVEFYQGASLIYTEDPATAPNGGTESYTYSTPFSDNISFSAVVTDDGTSGGPTNTTSNVVNFVFVYPYYFGAGAPARTAAQVAAMSKYVITSNANVARTFTSANGDVYYFAYPSSYGALTSILDVNNFETIGDWTQRTEMITGLNGVAVSYYIYEFENPVVAGTTTYTFKR